MTNQDQVRSDRDILRYLDPQRSIHFPEVPPGCRIIDSIVFRPCQLGTIPTELLRTIITSKVATQMKSICICAVVHTQSDEVQLFHYSHCQTVLTAGDAFFNVIL